MNTNKASDLIPTKLGSGENLYGSLYDLKVIEILFNDTNGI